ncbi:MAG: site-specific integrase, partial [Flavobacteriales bacterium]|nr:site-specific integrase [Flavobacteriales bacterium]
MREEFLEYLKSERRYSVHTVEAYETDLRQFFDFAEDEFELRGKDALNASAIRSWLVLLNELQLESKTIHRKLSSLRSFVKYLRAHDQLEKDPMVKIKAPKIPKRVPVFLDERSVAALFDEKIYPEGWEGKRDRLIVTLFYESGIRLSELIALNHRDVDQSGRL